jgi:hypothetical protein
MPGPPPPEWYPPRPRLHTVPLSALCVPCRRGFCESGLPFFCYEVTDIDITEIIARLTSTVASAGPAAAVSSPKNAPRLLQHRRMEWAYCCNCDWRIEAGRATDVRALPAAGISPTPWLSRDDSAKRFHF